MAKYAPNTPPKGPQPAAKGSQWQKTGGSKGRFNALSNAKRILFKGYV